MATKVTFAEIHQRWLPPVVAAGNDEQVVSNRAKVGSGSGATLLWGVGLLSILVVNLCYMAATQCSPTMAVVAVCAYVIFGYVLLKKQPLYFALIFLFYFGQLTAIVSCAYLEHGNFIIEQATYASATGGTTRLVIYDLVFLMTGYVMFRILMHRIPAIADFASYPTPKQVFGVTFSGLALLSIVYLGLFIYGTPLTMGLDRFDYVQNFQNPLFESVGGQLCVFSVLPGLLYATSKKRIFLFLYILTLTALILKGEKFSGLYMCTYWFLLPGLAKRVWSGNMRVSVSKLGAKIVLFLVPVALLVGYHYSRINVGLDRPVVQVIENRIFGLQGHVWWGIDEQKMTDQENVDYRQLAAETGALLPVGGDKSDVGMKYLIADLAPNQIAESYLERGVNFTMGYPAIGLVVFGYPGLFVLQILAAGLSVAAAGYVLLKLSQNQLLRLVLAVKIFIEIYAAFTVGNFFALCSWKMLMYVLAAMFLELAWRLTQVKRRSATGITVAQSNV